MNINVEKCVAYLRGIGIDITEEESTRWGQQQSDIRATRRAANRERKRSCGHFQTYWTVVYDEHGRTDCKACRLCGKYVESRPVHPPKPRRRNIA